MKTNYDVKVRSLVLAGALSIGVSFVSPTFAAAWIVGSNDEGFVKLTAADGSDVFPVSLNNAGQVVGVLPGGGGRSHAFMTGPNGMGMRDLGTFGGSYSIANGINDAGQVVGTFGPVGGEDHAFITGPNGAGMRDLGVLGGSFRFSLGNGINDAGQVVGWTSSTINTPHAFITGPNGMGMTDIGTLGDFSEAFAVNDTGQVVGRSQTIGVGSDIHAFITGPGGTGMTDLGTLNGGTSVARDINNAGQAVGFSGLHGFNRAFIAGPNGEGMRDLGTLGGRVSDAYSINDAGQVVGDSETAAGGFHAFITGPNGMGMTDLNSLVSLPNGQVLVQAVGINNLGQIIAISVIPEPATYALMLAGLCVLAFRARRSQIDCRVSVNTTGKDYVYWFGFDPTNNVKFELPLSAGRDSHSP